MKRLALALPVVLIATAPVLVSAPAEAKVKPRAQVTLAASATTVAEGQTVVLKGRVKTRAARTVVVLQRAEGSSWRYAARSTATKRFRFTVTVGEGDVQYRVRALRSNRARNGVSLPLTLTGLPTETPTVDTDLAKQQALILQYTNEFRAQNGKAPLALMPELNTVAQNWTQHMAANDDFRHNPDFFDQYPQDNLWGGGENIAVGYPSARAVVDGWINSPGHRANMLSDYTDLGVGWAQNASGRDYWTQNFAEYEEDSDF